MTLVPNIHDAEPIPAAARSAIDALMQSGDLFRYTAPQDAPVALLETEFAERLGSKYALAVSSCSAALFLSLKALSLPRDACVLIPGFTFAAVPSSVVHADCIPVLCEVGQNYRIDLEDFAAKLVSVQAVIISHMRGHTSDMDAIMKLCDAHEIPVIEDAAHSLGTTWHGRHIVNQHSTVTHYQRPNMTHPQEGGTGGEVSEILFFSAKSKRHPSLIYSMQIIPVCLSIVARRKGVSATRRGGLNWTPISLLVGHPCKLFHRHIGTFGKIGCFSFQSYKMINAGEGGILITDDADLVARAVIMSGAYEHNWKKHSGAPELEQAFARWQNRLPLYNLRMSNLGAAVIRPQIRELARRVRDGLANHDYIAGRLNTSANIDVPAPLAPECRAPDSIQFNLVGLDESEINAFAIAAESRGVKAQVFGLSKDNARAFWNWQFLPEQTDLPQTRAMLMSACDVRLPAHLTREELDVIADILLASVGEVIGPIPVYGT